jgi:hypothetical protein
LTPAATQVACTASGNDNPEQPVRNQRGRRHLRKGRKRSAGGQGGRHTLEGQAGRDLLVGGDLMKAAASGAGGNDVCYVDRSDQARGCEQRVRPQ